MAFTCKADVGAQDLADMLPTGVAVLNHEDESIFVNRRFHELMTCQSAKSFKCWSQSIHPEDHDRVTNAYFEALKAKHALRMEYRVRNQSHLWRVLMLSPLDEMDARRFQLGNEGGFICTIADITLEKTAELVQGSLAREAQERKQQQERFIDMISHEVRNPLSAILHCTEDILQAVKDNASSEMPLADIAQAAEIISLCVSHQKKIVDDVLTFSKLDASMLSLSPRSVQPKRQLAKTLSIFRPELRKQEISCEYKVDNCYADCGIDWVLADLDRMGQVLINLVSNAIKFTAKSHHKREIRVSMGASHKRPPSYPPNVVFFESGENVRLDATTKPEWGDGQVAYIMMAVKDTGIGISDEAQKQLFERFNQATPKTESMYGGSGLGLNVSRKLCHLHGGEIGVSSKEGQGSTFGFFFRVRQDSEPTDNESAESDEFCIESLCSGVKALTNEVTGVNEQTESPDISEDPVITHIQEIAPSAANDERKRHTSELARQVGSNTSTETENHVPSLRPESEKLQPANSHMASPVSGTSSEAKEPLHILVVEDNSINRCIMSRKLHSLGFHVSEANNGQEAVAAVQRDKFDCILMDQEMPVMDGESATIAIRKLDQERTTRTPILGVTANVRAAHQADMLKAGMDDIIHKPYQTNALFEKINQLVVLSQMD
jgi:signal transduction histidine kinase/ActR/RegA family two-component response regulator